LELQAKLVQLLVLRLALEQVHQVEVVMPLVAEQMDVLETPDPFVVVVVPVVVLEVVVPLQQEVMALPVLCVLPLQVHLFCPMQVLIKARVGF
jgi:hypothetical protein